MATKNKFSKLLGRVMSIFRRNRLSELKTVCMYGTGGVVSAYALIWASRKYHRRRHVPIISARDGQQSSTTIMPFFFFTGTSFGVVKAAEHERSSAAERDVETNEKEGDVFHQREQRFLDFASVIFNGEVYMTPQDFLHSVTQEGARARKYRILIDEDKVANWLKSVPPRKKGNCKMFRQLSEKGLISYVEYLFLLCILTEPKSGFEIAFNMFDIDGNKQVDYSEFNVLTKLFSHKVEKRQFTISDTIHPDDLPKATSTLPVTLERILTDARGEQKQTGKAVGKPASLKQRLLDIEAEKQTQRQPTTLLIHLFGPKGKDVLRYEDFAKFTQNLQEEVLDMEFQQYAKGQKTISEVDFAEILLRYTNLSQASVDEYVGRARDRIKDSKGITFEDFQNFFIFLNHMDDFVLMMRLYNMADQPISKEEFRRAVGICSEIDIAVPVIDAVYEIFDVDGDGHLSTEEFISIMKSRLKRGLRAHLVKGDRGWPKFKSCVRQEMRIQRGGL